MMRYLRGLNEWLGRDVEDRQAGLRGISFQVDQLRDDLNGLSMNVQALGRSQYQHGYHPSLT
jgi:hypothetical protein